MDGLMQPDALRARILLWADEQIKLSKLPPSSGRVLEAVLYRGNLPRREVASVVSASSRTATRIVSALTEAGVLTSDTPMRRYALFFRLLSQKYGCPDFSLRSENDGFCSDHPNLLPPDTHDSTTNQVTVQATIASRSFA